MMLCCVVLCCVVSYCVISCCGVLFYVVVSCIALYGKELVMAAVSGHPSQSQHLLSMGLICTMLKTV